MVVKQDGRKVLCTKYQESGAQAEVSISPKKCAQGVSGLRTLNQLLVPKLNFAKTPDKCQMIQIGMSRRIQ